MRPSTDPRFASLATRAPLVVAALGGLVLATAGFRCPGPEPSLGGLGGAGGDGGDGGSVGGTGNTGGAIGGGGMGNAGLGGMGNAGGLGGDGGIGGLGGLGGLGGMGGVGGVGNAGGLGGGGAGGAQGGGGAGGGCQAPLVDCGTGFCIDLDKDLMHCGACNRSCSNVNVDSQVCTTGVCKPFCLPGFYDVSQPAAPAPDDGCELSPRRVFVTSQIVLSTFNGAAGADAICQTTAAGLGGTWRAWVSDSVSSPQTRFDTYEVPYVLVDGVTVVAGSFSQLTSGALQHGIDQDQNGNVVGGAEVWTGTLSDGFGDGTGYCNDWTDNQSMATPSVGITTATDGGWTSTYFQFCAYDYQRLYCFEQ